MSSSPSSSLDLNAKTLQHKNHNFIWTVLCASHFLYGSANACWYPFLAIWLDSYKFHTSQIGVIATLNFLTILFFVPLCCAGCDRLVIYVLHKHQEKLRSIMKMKITKKTENSESLLLADASTLIQTEIVELNQIKHRVRIAYFVGMTLIACVFRFLFFLLPSLVRFDALFMLCIICGQCAHESVCSLLDSLTFAFLTQSVNPQNNESIDNKDMEYGKIRLFAGVGWALMAVLLGYLIAWVFHIRYMFVVFSALFLILAMLWIVFALYMYGCFICNKMSTVDVLQEYVCEFGIETSNKCNSKDLTNTPFYDHTFVGTVNKDLNATIMATTISKESSVDKQMHRDDYNDRRDKESLVAVRQVGLETHCELELQNTKSLNVSSFLVNIQTLASRITPAKLEMIVNLFALGICFGIINVYLFLRLQSLGASTLLMGTTLIVTVSSEIPAFYYSRNALNTFGSQGMLCIAMVAYILRLSYYGALGYTFTIFGIHISLQNPWYVMPAELLHGLTFAWVWSSIAIFANRLVALDAHNISKDSDVDEMHLQSFAQGCLNAIFCGFGQSVGAILGGVIYEYSNVHFVFFTPVFIVFPFFVFTFIRICRSRLVRSKK